VEALSAMLRRVVALVLCGLTAPLIIVFAAGIQLASPGPVFFRQVRVGKDGCEFKIHKLRTMVPDAERALPATLEATPAAVAEWKAYGRLTADPRIAGRFGRWARQLSVDELPQLLDVLAGDMVLVGPRPLPPDQMRELDAGARQLRQSVLPGITGLWQVSGRSDTSLRQMIRLDLFYVRRRGSRLDLYVLWQTPRAVLSARGAY
jgi:lipopolysaccharide/colanic/teichoic acid biosynthesis glycosyltransferase